MKSYGAALPLALALVAACARDASPPDELPDPTDAATVGDSLSDGHDAAGAAPVEDTGPSTDADAGVDVPPDGDASVAGDASEGSACTDTAPPASVRLSNTTVTNVKVGGGGNRADVAPGATISLALNFSLSATSCIAIDLPFLGLRVGFGEGPTDCSDTVSCIGSLGGGSSNKFTGTLTAPTTPGSYGVYAAVEHVSAQLTSDTCGQPFQDAPAESARIATICVQ